MTVLNRKIWVFAYLSVILLIPFYSGKAADLKSQLAAAEKAYLAKNYETSRDLYTDILRKNPKDLTALKGRALSALMLSDLQQVCRDMNLFISLDSNDADAYNSRGFARMYSDSILSSQEDFQRAISLDSNYTEAYINLAVTNISMHLEDKAVTLLEKAMQLDSNNIMSYRFCGFAYHNLKNYDSAIIYYNKAIAHGYKQPEIYQKIGNSYYKKNNFEKAAAYYSLVLDLIPGDQDALNNRAMAYANMGKDSLANADRHILDSARTAYLKSIDDGYDLTKSKYFSDKAKKFSIFMPEQFNEKNFQDTFSFVKYITAAKIMSRGTAFQLGASVEYIDSTKAKLSAESVQELIAYFKEYCAESLTHLASVQPYYDKQKQLSDTSLCMINKCDFLFKGDNQSYTQYLAGFISKGRLVIVRIVFPDQLSFKYEQMATDAIGKFSFTLRDNAKPQSKESSKHRP